MQPVLINMRLAADQQNRWSRVRATAWWPLALSLLLLCTACGPKVIKGRPPFISISAMELIDDRLAADFSISNENGVAMNIDGIEIRMTVETAQISEYDSGYTLEIAPNSTEKVHVDQLPDEFAHKLLTSLQDGEVKSLPFAIEGRVHTLEDGFLRFEHKGHLSPVPGRPNQFRAAVTQAEGLRRENPN